MSAVVWVQTSPHALRGCATPGCSRRPRYRLVILGHATCEEYCLSCRTEMQAAYDGALSERTVPA